MEARCRCPHTTKFTQRCGRGKDGCLCGGDIAEEEGPTRLGTGCPILGFRERGDNKHGAKACTEVRVRELLQETEKNMEPPKKKAKSGNHAVRPEDVLCWFATGALPRFSTRKYTPGPDSATDAKSHACLSSATRVTRFPNVCSHLQPALCKKYTTVVLLASPQPFCVPLVQAAGELRGAETRGARLRPRQCEMTWQGGIRVIKSCSTVPKGVCKTMCTICDAPQANPLSCVVAAKLAPN